MNNCPVPVCKASIQPPLPLCARHWYLVPATVRTEYWVTAFGPDPNRERAKQIVVACIVERVEALPAPAGDAS